MNASARPLQVQGKKAELQHRAAQLRTLEKDKTFSESKTDFDTKNKESDSFANVQETQRQREESGVVSPFNTLLLPPAYKLSTTRIVGRRALSAPPFDKKCLLEERSSSLSEEGKLTRTLKPLKHQVEDRNLPFPLVTNLTSLQSCFSRLHWI